MTKTEPVPAEAPRDCQLCPRLAAYRHECQTKQPDWFNGAVASFGDEDARLLVIGLAPGVTGANRTGRPFTGDWAGDLLYETLTKFGFANGKFDARPDDGLELIDTLVTNAVRCVPPQNKPVGAEINACRPFLMARIAALPRLTTLVTLGKIAHDSTIRGLGLKLKDYPFGHHRRYEINAEGYPPLTLISTYHCSRYNTNTKRLTTDMFESVFAEARAALG